MRLNDEWLIHLGLLGSEQRKIQLRADRNVTIARGSKGMSLIVKKIMIRRKTNKLAKDVVSTEYF